MANDPNHNEPDPKQDPQGTGGDQPPANPQPDPEPASHGDDDEYIKVKKSSYKKMQSDSTKTFERLRDVEAWASERAQKDAIGEFLEEKKSDFPDVTLADLMHVGDPDELEEVAGTVQRRLDDHAQNKLKNVQKAQRPQQTPEQKSQRLKKAKEKGDFAGMVAAKSTPTG